MTSDSTDQKEMFAAKLEKLINASDKTHIQIAFDIGYENQHIIKVIKQGTTRIPLDKVAPFARSLGADPASLIREWFAAYMPGALPDIEECVGLILTPSEKNWIEGLREKFSPVPPMDSRLLPIISDALSSF